MGDSKFTLQANYPGTITKILQDKGVEITSEGTLIQGIWGNGQVHFGNLQSNFGIGSSGNILDVDHLNTNHRGSILMAGHCSDAKTLSKEWTSFAWFDSGEYFITPFGSGVQIAVPDHGY